MSTAEETHEDVVSESRLVAAPAATIFEVLADPSRHTEIDGSGMLRGVVEGDVVSQVGDVFVMGMHYEQFGDYQMHNTIVELEPDRRIVWEPKRVPGIGLEAPADEDDNEPWHQRWGFELAPAGDGGSTLVTEIYDCSRSPEEARRIMKNGEVWREGIAATLANLDRVVAGGATVE